MTRTAVLWLCLPCFIQADETTVRAVLQKHCGGCHGTDKPKGGFRLDELTRDFAHKANRERWHTAWRQVHDGAMPPNGKNPLSNDERKQLADWITQQDQALAKAQGRVPLRRLNRTEYENTLRDLLGVQVDVKDLLPADSTSSGFDTSAEEQHLSSFMLERYLEAADKALNLAIANGPQPLRSSKRYLFKDERHVKATTERVFRTLEDGLAMYSSSAWQAITLSQFYPPQRGTYRIRLSVYATQSNGKPVTFRVLAGPMLMATKNHLVGYFDAPAEKPTVIEFTLQQEARSTINVLPYGLASAQAVHKVGADDWKEAGLVVQWVEVDGPIHEQWPPASHRQLFGDLPWSKAPTRNDSQRVEVTSPMPLVDAERLLRAFAQRAFRRFVSTDEVKPFLTLVQTKLEAKHSFEQAMRAGFLAIMMAPDFLFLREQPGLLDDFALASRLSYFFWSTMPDAELWTVASKKQLREPAILKQQVERLLKSPKSHAFVENFVGQWLGLRDIDFTEPSHILYPEFDEMLKVSMVRETELFFREMFESNLNIAYFLASDFTLLNGRLAKHYGIPSVEGWTFQKVKLPADSHRGGVLTMASVLKITANGTTTSPVLRGAWVLDRILGTPAGRPPADVPAVEPDIRGATTIREQLAKHRQVASCATCHVKIDPPGFALESFDVIGGYRDYYRTTGRGQPVMRDGRRMPYLQGPNVNPADQLADGRAFQSIDEFKQLLLKDKDTFARALIEKLLAYGTGATPTPSDHEAIRAIRQTIAKENDGFRSLLHAITQSPLFQSK